jgi:glycosyltransferase involved in cell wall biosynthesis
MPEHNERSPQKPRAKAADHASATGGCTEVNASCQHVAPIAVIIPTYNYGRFISEAIESVLQQSVQPSEILVVDDGSTDDTATVCSRHPCVRYTWKPNGGISSARNVGIQKTTAPYLMFLDADDTLLPGALARLYDAWQYADASVGAVFARTKLVWETARPLGETPEEYPDPREVNRYIARELAPGTFLLARRIIYHLLNVNLLPACSTLVQRRVFETCGPFDESLRSLEDNEVWTRITAKFSLLYINACVSNYRKHSASTTSNANWVRNHESLMRVLNIVRHSRWAPLELREFAHRRSSGVAYRIASRLQDMGDLAQACSYYLTSVGKDPCRLKAWIKLAACVLRLARQPTGMKQLLACRPRQDGSTQCRG